MRLVCVTLLTLLCLAAESDQLTCRCSSCPTGECTGDYCSTLMRTGQLFVTKDCLPSSAASLCATSPNLQCCNDTDYCNDVLDTGSGEGSVSDFIDTPDASTTEKPNTEGPPSSSFVGPNLIPLPSTTSTSGVLNTFYCFCRSGNCSTSVLYVGTHLCSTTFACAVEYVIALGEVVNSTQVCVNDESGCGQVAPGIYRSCCKAPLCNERPNLDDIPPEILGTSPVPTTTRPTTNVPSSHSDTIVTSSHTLTHTDIEFIIGTVVLLVFAFVLVLFMVVVTIVCCVKKRRTRRSKTITMVTVMHTTIANVQHVVGSVECIDSGYHGHREDASVQSIASSSSN